MLSVVLFEDRSSSRPCLELHHRLKTTVVATTPFSRDNEVDRENGQKSGEVIVDG